jgi:hypothetical protein
VNPCPACPAGYAFLTSNGNSTREAGQIQLRRLHNGFTATVQYSSSFDQRHLMSLQMQYTSGMGVGGGALLSGWKGRLFKEWTFGTQITAGSGFPLTPIYLAAVSGTGVTGSIRPDSTGASVYAAPPGFFLNPAAYTAPAPGRWGNAGRNSIIGPAQFALNASMGRTFRLGDRVILDLRVTLRTPSTTSPSPVGIRL